MELFRAAYLRNTELLSNGDEEAAFAWIPERFEWHVLGDGLPEDVRIEVPPVLRGRAEVIAYFRELAAEWHWRPEPEEFLNPGDGTLVVRSVGAMRGAASGLRGTVRFRQVWHFDEHGVPSAVRERLDGYRLDDLR
jgi:ketosteroid isomerase-like protein